MNFTSSWQDGRVPATKGTIMADRNQRLPANVPGPYYVDDTCIDCDLCRSTAPGVFRRNDDEAHSFVWHQPATPEELAAAEQAREECPTDTIGRDG
jgi:ferredoxin